MSYNVTTEAPVLLQEQFRRAMASVCTPVSVVTTISAGAPYGTTVSAFASLSMDPPMVLVSMNRDSELLQQVRAVGSFGLNVLTAGQAEVAMNFARKGGTEKFLGQPWDEVFGVPYLPGVAAFASCSVAAIVEGGDHYVLHGTVLGASAQDGDPLAYYNRLFGTFNAL